MTKIFCVIILLCSIQFFPGCGDSHNRGKCFENVQIAFPQGQVVPIDENGYRFIVKDKDGVIWYVKTANITNADISSKRKLF